VAWHHLCCAAVHSAAFAAARCTTASGIWANRATFSPNDAFATPGVSLYRNVILQHSQAQLLQQLTSWGDKTSQYCKPAPTVPPGGDVDTLT
jgi:hypothetical protein